MWLSVRKRLSLQNEGYFSSIGLSEANASSLRRARAIAPIADIEIELSLWSMEPANMGVVATSNELEIPIAAYSPLELGFLTGTFRKPEDRNLGKGDRRLTDPEFQGKNLVKNVDLVHKLEEMAKKLGRTTAQIALAFILRLSPMYVSFRSVDLMLTVGFHRSSPSPGRAHQCASQPTSNPPTSSSPMRTSRRSMISTRASPSLVIGTSRISWLAWCVVPVRGREDAR